MAELGYTLRSGAAEGSDTAFQEGVCKVDPKLTQIWLPKPNFNKKKVQHKYPKCNYHNINEDMIDYAGNRYLSLCIIPYWDNLEEDIKRFHGRNYYQVFGVQSVVKGFPSDPDTRVCIYAAPEKNGVVEGGTRSAVYLSRYLGVPTYNVLIPKQKEELLSKLKMKP